MADNQIVDERIQDLPAANEVQSGDLFVIASAANGYNAMQASGQVVTAYVEATAGSYATQAQASATAAQQAQQSAAASASTATSASQEASQTIDTIRGYATQAQEASQSAATSATNASSAQTAAEAAQTAAAASQSAAAQSATAAQSSAQTATTAQQGAEAAQTAAEQAAEQVQAIVAGNEAYTKQESNDRFALALKTTEGPAESLTVYPDAGSNITITSQGFTTQAGSGDPSPTNVRPITVGGMRLIKQILNGSEAWFTASTNDQNIKSMLLKVPGMSAVSDTSVVPQNVFSDQYKTGSAGIIYSRQGDYITACDFSAFGPCLNIYAQSIMDTDPQTVVSAWKSYLSENPLTVWYAMEDGSGDLYTPQITEGADYYCQCLPLNEPLCAGDSVSSNGKEYHIWKLLTFNGTEAWYISDETGPQRRFDLPLPAESTDSHSSLCSHAIQPRISTYQSGTYYVGLRYTCFYDPDSVWSDVNAFKAYLAEQFNAGTPVQLLYKMATPETYTNPATPFIATPAADGSVAISGQTGGEMSATYNKSLARAFQELQAAVQALQASTQPETSPGEEVNT